MFTNTGCELCDSVDGSSLYFHKLEARCRDCGNMGAHTIAIGGCLLFLGLLCVGASTALNKCCGPRPRRMLIRWGRKGAKLWRKAGMRYKVKAFVGLYQCLAAVSSVFDVIPPRGCASLDRMVEPL